MSKLQDLTHTIEQRYISLEENNPKAVLSKGYAVLENADGLVISSIKNLVPEKRYKLYLKDGSVEITISDLKEGDKL